jgi:hypothetical protein
MSSAHKRRSPSRTAWGTDADGSAADNVVNFP